MANASRRGARESLTMALAGLRGLYALTDAALCAPHGGVVAAVALALAGGARLVQYRDKSDDRSRRLAEARALVALCHARGALLIINDDVALALACAADGVHLGRDDATVTAARAQLAPRALVGVSCYDSLDRARQAAAAGADYLAFGSIHRSRTKPDAVQAPLGLLSAARDGTGSAICAIGGIEPQHMATLIGAGAALVAVCAGVFGTSDPRAAARRYAESFA